MFCNICTLHFCVFVTLYILCTIFADIFCYSNDILQIHILKFKKRTPSYRSSNFLNNVSSSAGIAFTRFSAISSGRFFISPSTHWVVIYTDP